MNDSGWPKTMTNWQWLCSWVPGMLIGMLVVGILSTPKPAQAGCYSYYPSYYGSYGYNYGYNYNYQPYYPPKVIERTIIDYYPVYQVGYIPPAAVTTTTTQTVETASVQQASVATVGAVRQAAAVGAGQGGGVNVIVGGKSSCEQKLADLTMRFADLEKKLDALIAPPDPAGGKKPEAKANPNANPNVAKSVILNECAVCHDKAVAGAKGKNLVLSDAGKHVAFTPDLLGKCIRKVSRNEMPLKEGGEKAPLSEQRFNEIGRAHV